MDETIAKKTKKTKKVLPKDSNVDINIFESQYIINIFFYF